MKKPDFRAFTVKHDGIARRIITPIKLTKAYNPAREPNPGYPEVNTSALWDTGATGSVITKETANKLNLVPTGMVTVNHAGGSGEANTYLVNLFLPNDVMMIGIQVSECPDVAGNFGVIVGMDIINMGDMSITNVKGKTIMSFWLPSIEKIDYVIEANRIKYADVDKYGPCPCGKTDEKGKRKKFKFCCGKDLY